MSAVIPCKIVYPLPGPRVPTSPVLGHRMSAPPCQSPVLSRSQSPPPLWCRPSLVAPPVSEARQPTVTAPCEYRLRCGLRRQQQHHAQFYPPSGPARSPRSPRAEPSPRMSSLSISEALYQHQAQRGAARDASGNGSSGSGRDNNPPVYRGSAGRKPGQQARAQVGASGGPGGSGSSAGFHPPPREPRHVTARTSGATTSGAGSSTGGYPPGGGKTPRHLAARAAIRSGASRSSVGGGTSLRGCSKAPSRLGGEVYSGLAHSSFSGAGSASGGGFRPSPREGVGSGAAPPPLNLSSLTMRETLDDSVYHQGIDDLERGGLDVRLPCGLLPAEVSELLFREITPEDYEMLLQLDENVVRPTTSRASVEGLPQASGEDFVGEKCTICMAAFDSGDSVAVLPCKHLFHRCCISRWLMERRSACPLCGCEVPQS